MTQISRRKTLFTAKHDQQVKVYNDLLCGIQIVKKILPEYDGKMLNRKIIETLKKEINVHGLHFSLDGGFLMIGDYNNRHYKDPFSDCGCYYIDSYKARIDIATRTVSKSERLDWLQTQLNIEEERQRITNAIVQLNTDLYQFDAEEQAYAEIEQAVEKYRNSFGYNIRRYIKMD